MTQPPKAKLFLSKVCSNQFVVVDLCFPGQREHFRIFSTCIQTSVDVTKSM